MVLEETPIVSRFDINCGNVWREFEDEFTDIAPPSEYDQNFLMVCEPNSRSPGNIEESRTS